MAKKNPGLVLAAFLGIFLLAESLLAGPTATLTGRVTDISGAVIASVRVEATNTETTRFFGETNEEGLYTIPDLPPGKLSHERAETCFPGHRQAGRRTARARGGPAEFLDGDRRGGGEHYGGRRRAADPGDSAARRRLLIP